jgi:chromosomal replication initiator protein
MRGEASSSKSKSGEATDMTPTDQDRWSRVKGRLKAEVGDDIFSSWFARMDLEAVEKETARHSVPTRFLKSWIQSHYSDRLLSCWQAEEQTVQRIELTVRTATRPMVRPPLAAEQSEPARAIRVATNGGAGFGGQPPSGTMNDDLGGSPLDGRLTFDTFVVGRSNTLAHAAAKQVAVARRGDSVMFNPLYIHAGVGLGKTHLLHAVTWAGNAGGERKVLYLTVEKFMYGFVSALKSQTAIAFKEAVRGIDVLVIDDLQFLTGKNIQAEFCHTLNALIDAGRQVVIAADRPPTELESLDDRMRSRLAGGLVVEMGPLPEEMRLEILKSRISAARSHHAGFSLPEPVIAFIAKAVTHNGRDLEGAEPHARAQQADGPARDARNGRAGGSRPRSPSGASPRQDRGHSARRGAAIQRKPQRSPVLAADGQCRAPAADRDVPGQDPDAAVAAGNRSPVRGARPHHRSARRAQDRRAARLGHVSG